MLPAMTVPIPLRASYDEAARLERRSWHRAIAASALGAVQHGDPARILKGAWPRDERAATILRSATAPADTTSAAALAPDLVDAFRSLAPGSAALRLFEAGLKIELTGVHSVKLPDVASWPPQPIFVAEGAPAPNLQWGFTGTVIGPTRKILVIAATSGELENATPETASAVIGRVLADATTKSLDTIAFGTQADDGVTPAGLLHGATPITAATAGVDAMSEDLGALTGAIGAAGIDATGSVFVAGPREATIMRVKVGPRFDSPILTTLGLPAKTVACFAPAALASGYRDAPQIETSREASYHEESSPAQIVAPGGAVAAPVRSVFQTNVIAIRVRARAAWAVAQGGAQVVANVNW